MVVFFSLRNVLLEMSLLNLCMVDKYSQRKRSLRKSGKKVGVAGFSHVGDVGQLLPFTATTGELLWEPIQSKRNGNKTIFKWYLSLLYTLTGRYAELQVEFSAAVCTSAEQKELILKLEHDLSTIQDMSTLQRPDADGSEVSNMENIPDPVKEASAMFSGMSPG